MSTSAPTAIVLDAEQRSALAVVRSLGKAGIQVTAASHDRRAMAFRSRYCTDTAVYPNPRDRAPEFLSWLQTLSRIATAAVLIPVTDCTVRLCLEAKPMLGSLRLPFPEFDAYMEAADKYRLAALCRRLNVRYPMTVLVDSLEHETTIEPLGFPVVIKPRIGGAPAAFKVAYAQSSAEAWPLIAKLLPTAPGGVLVQQYIEGEGRGVFVLCEDGKARARFAHRRLREKPPSGGVSVLSESVSIDSSMIEALERVLAELRWNGVAMGEFRSAADGSNVLLEINGRFWGSLQLAIDCGVDFPRLLVTGEQAPPDFAVGRRLRWVLGDLDHTYLLCTQASSGVATTDKLRAVARALTPWLPGTRQEVFRLDDPGPFFSEMASYIAAGVGRVS